MNQSSSERLPVQTWVFTSTQAPDFTKTTLRKLRIKLGFKVLVRTDIVNKDLTYRISAKEPTFASELEEYMQKILPKVPPRMCDPCNSVFL
jgi:hypothetical protein